MINSHAVATLAPLAQLLLVQPTGIEPVSEAFQTPAITRLAQAALVLGEGIEPSFVDYRSTVLPLN